jgi:MoaA/NifB/PqqE/SkfB family radical SAM enzyme
MWAITGRCNFDCAYCIVDREHRINDVIRDIDIQACVRTLNNTKKIFNVYFTGGEPFLVPRFVELCKALCERHFITIASNLSRSTVMDFAREIDPKRVLMVNASFHGDELMRHNAYGTFVANFRKLRDQGFCIKASEIAFPEIISKVQYYRDLLRKEGIDLDFNPYIGNYDGKRYPAAYTSREIKYFGFKEKRFHEFSPGDMYCNAGYNAVTIISSGEAAPCFNRYDDKIGTITTGIRLRNNMMHCYKTKCQCLMPRYFPDIYCQALFQTGHYPVWLWTLIMQTVRGIIKSR